MWIIYQTTCLCARRMPLTDTGTLEYIHVRARSAILPCLRCLLPIPQVFWQTPHDAAKNYVRKKVQDLNAYRPVEFSKRLRSYQMILERCIVWGIRDEDSENKTADDIFINIFSFLPLFPVVNLQMCMHFSYRHKHPQTSTLLYFSTYYFILLIIGNYCVSNWIFDA